MNPLPHRQPEACRATLNMTRCKFPWWLYCHPAGFTWLVDDRASCCTGPAALLIAALSDHWNNSQVALVVKNLPANAGDIRDVGLIPGSGRSLGEGHAAHSSILAWRIPWTEESGELQSMGFQSVRYVPSIHLSVSIGVIFHLH